MPRYFADFQSYRKAWDDAIAVDPPIPLNIDIELSAVCNLRCPMCFITSPDYVKSTGSHFMDIDLAKRIISKAAGIGIPAIKLNWRGEPLTYPHFAEIAVFACACGAFYEILINTNANFEVTRELRDALYNCKLMVSLDSMNNNTYSIMRQGGKLSVALDFIAAFAGRHDKLYVRRVITELNKNEDFAGEVRQAFGDCVQVSEHYCFDRGSHNISIGSDNISKNAENIDVERTYCGYPSQRIVIDVNGDMYPCCVDYNHTMKLGNFNDISIIDVWNGAYLRDLRNKLRNNTIPNTACKDCTSFMAYNRKERDYVQDKIISSSGA